MEGENEEVIEHDEEAHETDEPENQEERQEPTPDPEIEREAAKWGHAPKNKWQGDPKDWMPPEQFLNDPRTQRRIREASDKRFAEQEARHKEEMAALKRATDLANKRIAEVEKGGHETRISNLQRQIEAAAEDGNIDEVRRLTGELTKIKPPLPEKEEGGSQDGPGPELRQWLVENPWFEADNALQFEARAIEARLVKEHPHMPDKERLDRIASEVKKRNPEVFGITNGSGEPREERVQRVAGSEARGGGGGGNARSFSAIPAADRAIAKKHYIGEGKVFKSESEYARAYFDEHGTEQ